MKIFVTGGTGFIGSYVVNELVGRGHQVTILARNAEKVGGFLGRKEIEILQGTIYDREAIQQGLEGKDACIHIALGWGNTPEAMLEADTKPSVFIFETAAKLGVKNLLYTSSTAAIGELRKSMGSSISTRPVDIYGASKAATEAYLLAMAPVFNLRCNIIRPGYTFGNPVVEGASMQPDSRFRDIVGKVVRHEPVKLIQNDGTQFIWAGDLAKLYGTVVESDLNRETLIGLSTEFTTWEEIAQMAIDYTSSDSKIHLEDKGLGKEDFLFDVTGMEEKFGYKFTAKERLKEHVIYIADHQK